MEKHPLSQYSPYLLLDKIFNKIKLNNFHRNIKFKFFILNNYSKELCEYLYDTYPYTDIFKMSLYDVEYKFTKQTLMKKIIFLFCRVV